MTPWWEPLQESVRSHTPTHLASVWLISMKYRRQDYGREQWCLIIALGEFQR